MSIRTEIAIPWRDTGDPHRREALAYVLAHYARLGSAAFPTSVTLGDTQSRRFSRTGARNAAAEGAGDWDVLVMADADCVVQGEVLEHAVELAHRTRKVILPHDRFMELTQEGTQLALAEYEIARWQHDWCQLAEYERKRPSGVIVFPRKAWELVGGYDERFKGWGFEDTAMLWNIEDLAYGWERLSGRIWHLWHPPASTTWLKSDKQLFERYKLAHGDPVKMYALLLERQRQDARLTA